MRYCFVRQDGIKDCGVACLLMIIRTYKGNCSKEYLRDLTHTTKDGTTAYDLMQAGEKFHFTTFGLRGKVEDLKEEYFPVIAHVVKDERYHHFVVIYKFNKAKQEFIIADPAISIQKISISDFKKISTEQFIIFLQNAPILKINPTHPIWAILKDFFKQNRKSVIIVFIFSFLYMVVSIILTFCFQSFMTYSMKSTIENTFTLCTILFILLALLKGILQYIRISCLIQITHNFDTHLFQNIYHHLFLLPDSYYQNRTTGELLARITDLVTLKNVISKFLLDVGMDSILAIFSLVLLFLLSTSLSVILILFVFLDISIFLLFRNKMRKNIYSFKESYAKFHSYLVDTIESLASIRHLERQSYIENKFQIKHQEQLKESIQYQKVWNLQLLFKNSIHGISQILLIAVGCYLISIDKMNSPTLISYLFLSSFFLNPIESIYEFLLDFQDGKESFKRIEEFYQVKEERNANDMKNSEIKYLEIRDLNYFYRKKERVLVDFHQSFVKGEKILIYGSSGCGKSTLIKILAGYLDSYTGTILMNGKKLLKNETDFLRSSVTYIAQNETLLNMSLRENILLGREISEEKFQTVCKLLQIDEFASKNVLTYDMPIEENGCNLSGGEKQRIILARSILRESEIYMLDESLCNMDIALERQILINLFNYLKDKLVIVVSHRFYNEDLYDRKIHLEKGGIYAENRTG